MPVAANADHHESPAVVGSTVTTLLDHAAFAAGVVGHLHDVSAALFRDHGDHVAAIPHGLAEVLGGRRVLAASDETGPDDRKAHDGAPMLTPRAEDVL